MDRTGLTILILVVVLAAIALVGWLYQRKRRSTRLRRRFGPEYDRVLHEKGNVRKAEGVLEWRAQKREQLRIVPLSPAVRADFENRWTRVQSLFVDDPKAAVTEADLLVSELMHARGYPVAEFDQQADIISVDHPVVAQNYRSAHDVALRHSRGQASTEDLRTAMVHYRTLFSELLQDTLPERKEALG